MAEIISPRNKVAQERKRSKSKDFMSKGCLVIYQCLSALIAGNVWRTGAGFCDLVAVFCLLFQNLSLCAVRCSVGLFKDRMNDVHKVMLGSNVGQNFCGDTNGHLFAYVIKFFE